MTITEILADMLDYSISQPSISKPWAKTKGFNGGQRASIFTMRRIVIQLNESR